MCIRDRHISQLRHKPVQASQAVYERAVAEMLLDERKAVCDMLNRHGVLTLSLIHIFRYISFCYVRLITYHATHHLRGGSQYCVHSVSYTHLDVYKRQIRTSSRVVCVSA